MINQKIIEELTSTAEYYETNGDEGRYNAYKKAVASIKEYGKPIKSGAEAKKLKWIGDSISAQIDNILGLKNTSSTSTSTSTSKKRTPHDDKEDSLESPQKTVVTLIDNIRHKAKEKQEKTSMAAIDKITRKTRQPIKSDNPPQQKTLLPTQTPRSKLNKDSRTLRIKQYEFSPKPEQHAAVVRRSDLDQFVVCVKRAWTKLIDKQSSKGIKYNGKLECCGGFRRGETWCHECVIVLTSDMSIQRQRYLFDELLKLLYKLKLTETYKVSEPDYYQGVVDISKLFRSQRTHTIPSKQTNVPLVLRLTDEGGWPCSLLRWTGPKSFWIKLQSSAQQFNYELLENGLYTKSNGNLGKRLFHRDEYDVLSDIDVPYTEPVFRK